MKIIDLLNKIANGEEVPKFWWNGCIHEIDEYNMIYDTYCNKCKIITIECLNDEIKPIEEQQDIDIQDIEELDEEIAYTNIDIATSWNTGEKKIVKQQNQILKYLKQLDRKIKER